MYSVTFVSNYINHHQLPFCKAMWELLGDGFHFIQTMPMEQKRIDMGWGLDPKEYPFVELFYENKERCRRLLLESDVAIFGWSEGLVSDIEAQRFSSGKLSFKMSERIYREGQWKFLSPKGLCNKYNEHVRYRKMPVFLLCTGAYVASDFSLIRSYPGKMLKWGYFPNAEDAEEVSVDEPTKDSLETDSLRLCWAGRMIDLKHPEFAIEAAKSLKEKGYDFTLDMVGDGNLKMYLEKLVANYGLKNDVRFWGNLKPAEVLNVMKASDVFLFTSNYLEGWGAVVNEAMQNGCCVVASYEAGAVPFLIEDGVNGLCYKDGSFDEFIAKLEYLFNNKNVVKVLAERGKSTISGKWNAQKAAGEFMRFCTEYLENGRISPSVDGPMSVAEVIKPAGFKRTLKEKNRLE